MADGIECLLSEEGVEVEEYICESSRRLQEGMDDTRLAQETRTEGANITSAGFLHL